MNSLILDLVNSNDNWREVCEELHIEVKEKYPLVLFKYKMDAHFSNLIVQEARGIILDIQSKCVAAWPFRKFGNYGESYADNIDWASARVQEKLDGSIIKLFYWNNKWNIATNGSIDAYEISNSYGYNFGDMAEMILSKQNLEYNKLDINYTYIFELTSPNNRIVVPYTEDTMWHIGTRNNITGEEINADIGMPKPKEYPLYSLEDCISFAKHFSAQEHEGFVVVDKNWNRVKVKSPDYVAAHHMQNNYVLTRKKIIELICNGEHEEYLTYFIDKKSKFDEVLAEIVKIKTDITAYCDIVAEMGLSKKDYAINHFKDDYFTFAIKKVYDNKEPNI